MDTAQWPQPREEIPKAAGSGGKITTKTTKKEEEEAVKKCPRCNSTNTKFCYYNNYSLTQPRYFCKTCRRYWTQGGSLRNIPVGGGSRKNKRSSSSYSKSLPNLVSHDPINPSLQNPNHDLNLGFTPNPNPPTSFSDLIQLDSSKGFHVPASGCAPSVAGAGSCSLPVSALELLTGVSVGTRGFGGSDFGSIYNTSGFDGLNEMKPMSLGFSVDGINGSGNHEENTTNGRLLFPFEDLKQVSSNDNNGENGIVEKSDSMGYWSGMLGGNGSW